VQKLRKNYEKTCILEIKNHFKEEDIEKLISYGVDFITTNILE